MYSIFSQCGKQAYGIVHYVVDTKAELTNIELTYLPMGCIAYVINDKKYYILNGEKEWKEFNIGGGSVDPDPPEPPEDIFLIYNQADLVEFLTNPELPNKMKVMADLNLDMDIVIEPESRGVTKQFYLNNKNIELNNHKIIVKNEGVLILKEGGNIFANNVVIECSNGTLETSESSVHIESYNDTAIKAINNSFVSLTGECEVVAEENCILLSNGSSLKTEEEVSLTSYNNFVIGGDENDQSNNSISIDLDGTTIYANSSSSNYLACGIYLPIVGNIVIQNSEIFANDGCGICQRTGDVSIKDNVVIHATGTEEKNSGKVGNSDIIIHTSGIVYDQISHYNNGESFYLELYSDNYYIEGYYKSIEVLKDEEYQPDIYIEEGGTLIPPYEPEPSETEAYAVFDSTDNSLVFFRDEPGKYSDREPIGTKTYYTGIESKSNDWNWGRTITTVKFDDVIKPISTYQWFSESKQLTTIIDIDKLDTSNVINMQAMFSDCEALTSLDVSSFNTTSVTNMSSMFDRCESLESLNISGFDTSNVTNMDGMFAWCSSLTALDVSGFNTSKVTNMANMFAGCTSLTLLDLSNFNTSNVTEMSFMFNNCESLLSLGSNNFDTSNATDMDYIFNQCNSLTADIIINDVAKTASEMFIGAAMNPPAKITLYGDDSVTSSDIDNIITATKAITPTSNIVNGMQSNTEVYAVYNQDLKTLTFFEDEIGKYTDKEEIDDKIYYAGIEEENYNPAPFARWHNQMLEATFLTKVEPKASRINWFSSISTLKNITGLENLDTSHITDMSSMFQNCEDLISIDISTFDVSNVTDMSYMFSGCENIKSINLEGLIAPNLTNINYMFTSCFNLENISFTDFEAPNIVNVENLFADCNSLTSLDISWFNTDNIQDIMYGVFSDCYNLTTLGIDKFIIPKSVFSITGIFNNCYNLTATVFLNDTYWDDYNNAFYDAAKDSGVITIQYDNSLGYEDIEEYIDANKGEGNIVIQNTI